MNKKYFFMLTLAIMKVASASSIDNVEDSCYRLNEMFTQLNTMEFHNKDLSLSKYRLIEAILLLTQACNKGRLGSDLHQRKLEPEITSLRKMIVNQLADLQKLPHTNTKTPIKYSQNPEVNNACQNVEDILKTLPETAGTQNIDIIVLRHILLDALLVCNSLRYSTVEIQAHTVKKDIIKLVD